MSSYDQYWSYVRTSVRVCRSRAMWLGERGHKGELGSRIWGVICVFWRSVFGLAGFVRRVTAAPFARHDLVRDKKLWLWLRCAVCVCAFLFPCFPITKTDGVVWQQKNQVHRFSSSCVSQLSCQEKFPIARRLSVIALLLSHLFNRLQSPTLGSVTLFEDKRNRKRFEQNKQKQTHNKQ